METVHNKSTLVDGRCKSVCIIYILYQSMMRYREALSFNFFLLLEMINDAMAEFSIYKKFHKNFQLVFIIS